MKRVIQLGERLGMVRALQPLYDRWSSSLAVLAYHRVLPVEHVDTYPFDLDLISATPTQFEYQMAYLRRYFNPVSLADVVAHLDGIRPLPKRAVAVTFDDGYSDTYRYAFPILQRYSIPSTVFVTTGYIDSGEPFWFEVAAYLALRAAPGTLELAGCAQPLPAGESAAERRQAVRALQAALKTLPNSRRTAIVAEWSRQFAAQADEDALALSRPLSWSQIEELASAGVAFGSHSVTHPNLTQLADAELEWELVESKRALEARLQRPILTLAYPIGTSEAFDARVAAAARHAGFRLGISYIRGGNSLATLDPFGLRRHGIERDHSRGYFRAVTALPSWFT